MNQEKKMQWENMLKERNSHSAMGHTESIIELCSCRERWLSEKASKWDRRNWILQDEKQFTRLVGGDIEVVPGQNKIKYKNMTAQDDDNDDDGDGGGALCSKLHCTHINSFNPTTSNKANTHISILQMR